ncbi:uroporphyrinogen-III C-methyltransferase [Chromatiaceae bacterium AAb-1]|nr:uroporphyrinogen-III C-methyltransferase [Chromatiaceae bacterium AAb-1]
MSVLTFLFRPVSNWLIPANVSSFGSRATATATKPGKVYLIGAGPGDPELLTLKAHRLLQQADIVLYDWLVSGELLAMLPARTRKVFAGKRAGQHSLSQAEICRLLVDYARQGLTVVRLKGGDPSIFARVSEEAEVLHAAAIPFAIVPGITTACAAAAYTGIPLTARNLARSVSFITAQFADPAQQPDWQQWRYHSNGDNPTLVVYMGLGRLSQLCQGLMQVGWPAKTPVALLENVSTPEQRNLTGNLATIETRLQQQPLSGPTLIIIGEVVSQQMAVDCSLLLQHTTPLIRTA